VRTRATLFIALVVALLPAGIAQAESPVTVDAAITDESGVLGADAAAAEDAVAELRSEKGIVLSAVFVPTFDDETDDADWAELTAQQSGLGDQEVLLAIATDTVEYEWWIGDNAPLDSDAVDTLMSEDVEPSILDEEWSDAVVAMAEGLETDADSASSPWSPVTTTVVVLVLVGALGGLYLMSRRGSSSGQAPDRSASSQG